jgi:DNA-binding transcriptional ArsR family regulator
MQANPETAMPTQLLVSSAAFLIADPARALMLNALLDGRALPAGELAYAAGITAQTASAHLAKLLDGGLLSVEAEGRHRYYRLADGHVAQALESLALIAPEGQLRRKPLSPEQRRLRQARRCYDHLAGRLGVALARALQEREYLRAAADKQFDVTTAGERWFSSMGLEVAGVASKLRPTARGLARQCLDWTERQHHVGGPLGVELMRLLCDKGWLKRSDASRAMRVTPAGWTGLKRELGIEEEALAV